MLIKDHWYIACPSSQLGENQPRAVQIGGEHLVVFRSLGGDAHALLDRCCHRGVRLSCGRIQNGRIACGYHGWEYDADGKLVSVPSLGEGSSPPSYSVPSYRVRERDHYIWVWIEGASAEPTYEPSIRGLTDGMWIQQTAVWNTNVMPAVENQLDVAHTKFSHPGIYPGHKTEAGARPPLQDLEFECRSSENTVIVFSPPRADSTSPPPSLDAPEGGIGYFELPYRNYVFLAADGARAIYNWVPLGESSCRLEFMGSSAGTGPSEQKPEGRQVLFLDRELELLAQDRVLLESAQFWLDQGKGESERSVPSDVAPLMARSLVASVLRANGSATQRGTQRRVFKCTC